MTSRSHPLGGIIGFRILIGRLKARGELSQVLQILNLFVGIKQLTQSVPHLAWMAVIMVSVGGCTDTDSLDEKLLSVSSALRDIPSVTEDCVIDQSLINKNYDVSIDWQNTESTTDFFLLVFSNSPGFCKSRQQQGQYPASLRFQCQSSNHFGWVLHGLWANNEAAYKDGDKYGHPRFCKGDLPSVDPELLESYLCMSPGMRLLQGEWEKHGACTFDEPRAYFNKSLELFKRYDLPPADMNARDAMNWMKDNHPELKSLWLHLTNTEFGICFDANFDPQSCPGMIQ